MNNTIKYFIMCIGTFCLYACASTPTIIKSEKESAPEQSSAQESFNLEALSCWDLLTALDEDIPFVLVMLYSYNAGENGDAEQSSKMISTSIDKAETKCTESPDMLALDAFRK